MTRYLTVYTGIVPTLTRVFSVWLLLNAPGLQAAPPGQTISIELGDYRFAPRQISITAGETVQLELTNTDGLTPHNFTLQAKDAGLDVDVDVGAGKTHSVEITPLLPGTYTFLCNKKLPFMKSHRDRGMEGTLIVVPASPE